MTERLNRLRQFLYSHAARFCRFAAVGATGAVVDLFVFSLLLSLCAFGLARALAIWSAMSWNFLLNRWWTFSDARSGPIVRQYTLFCASCLAGALVNWSVTLGLHFVLTYFAERTMLAAACGIIAGAAANYLLSAHIAFRVVPRRIEPRGAAVTRVDRHGVPGRESGNHSRRGRQAAGRQERLSGLD